MSNQRRHQSPSQEAILRAVASSTAIDTGQRIADIEAKLRSGDSHLPQVSLTTLNRPAQPAQR